jgi:hypothetical protein
MPVNFKIYLVLKHATIARKVFIKVPKVFRIALAVVLDNTKTKKVKTHAKNVK